MKYALVSKDDSFSLKELLGPAAKRPEVVIAYGGDGTVLYSEQLYPGVPKLAIGKGRLSFLAEVNESEMMWALELLKKKKFTIEERTKLSSNLLPDALNDFALTGAEPGRMVEFEMLVNDKVADTIRGDGLVVATPTGSTAHALSAGGPIISPSSKVFAIVPLAPFKLRSRPLVVSDDSIIKIIPRTPAMLSGDGIGSMAVNEGKELVFRKAKTVARFIRVRPKNFFEKLKEL